MELKTFLRKVVTEPNDHFFVVGPDNLGLLDLLKGALKAVAAAEDFEAIPAASLSKERVRQLERDAHIAPRGSSDQNHFFIYGMRNLPYLSVGHLLKTVEECKSSRFIFQSQVELRKLKTIQSRCQVVYLPFLTKRTVLGTMKLDNHDWLTADRLGLYDGTLDGTIRALGTKDTVATMRRELSKGSRGLIALTEDDIINSTVFRQVFWEEMTKDERLFLERSDTPTRRRIITFLVARRKG